MFLTNELYKYIIWTDHDDVYQSQSNKDDNITYLFSRYFEYI